MNGECKKEKCDNCGQCKKEPKPRYKFHLDNLWFMMAVGWLPIDHKTLAIVGDLIACGNPRIQSIVANYY